MRPGEAAFDQTLVDRIECVIDGDDSACWKDLHLDGIASECSNVCREPLQHDHFVGTRRNHRLNTDLNGLILSDCST